MATERYFVGPRLLTDIRDTISRVQGMPDRSSGGFLPGMYIPLTPPLGEGGAMKLGKTTADWLKGTTQQIQLWPSGSQASPPASQEAYNVFAPVSVNKWVMIAQEAGGNWYLIAAEC